MEYPTMNISTGELRAHDDVLRHQPSTTLNSKTLQQPKHHHEDHKATAAKQANKRTATKTMKARRMK